MNRLGFWVYLLGLSSSVAYFAMFLVIELRKGNWAWAAVLAVGVAGGLLAISSSLKLHRIARAPAGLRTGGTCPEDPRSRSEGKVT